MNSKKLLVVSALLLCTTASANERHFTYTYETAVLPTGNVELETWTTLRAGKDDYYVALDNRLEIEIGITDWFQAALYTNFRGTAVEKGDVLTKSFDYKGVDLELKWKLADPVADPLGVGLYFEVGGQPHEVELEGKVLLDKRVGNLLFAFNAIGELEIKRSNGETDLVEVIAEANIGLGYFVLPHLLVGVEIRNRTIFAKGDSDSLEFETSAFFGGPVISYARDSWWMALTVLPQFAAIKEHGDGLLDLEEHENIETRLLLGVHL